MRIRWIAGFGEIHWIDASSYQEAVFDRIAYSGKGIIEHMNDDHRDALTEFLAYYKSITCNEQQCRMVTVDSSGFTIETSKDGGSSRVYIEYPRPASEQMSVRELMIEMLKQCREEE